MNRLLKVASIFQTKLAERRKGRSLPETGYKWKYINIYRAVPITVLDFEPMSYVTRGEKWAKGHANHSAYVNDEPYHVLKLMVLAKDVFECENVGANEYYYDGPQKKGQIIYKTKPESV